MGMGGGRGGLGGEGVGLDSSGPSYQFLQSKIDSVYVLHKHTCCMCYVVVICIVGVFVVYVYCVLCLCVCLLCVVCDYYMLVYCICEIMCLWCV